MDLTRRHLLRAGAATAALGAVADVTGAALAPAAEAASALTTAGARILRGTPGRGGYARLVTRAGEPHLVRTDLGVAAAAGRARRRTGLLAFAQLSDVHVVDHQSPARVEWLDRYDDKDASSDPSPGIFAAAYRPQEVLSAQVVDAMVRAINAVRVGPVTGRPLAFALQTGDNSDNSQYNEVRWNIDTLDGARVRPDSGDPTRCEGVMDADPTSYDEHYWHPGGTPAGKRDDEPRATYGLPVIKGLLSAARRPFTAVGLDVPWYSAFGNHDQLVSGNFPHTLPLNAVAVGALKVISAPAALSEADAVAAVRSGDLAGLLTRALALPGARVVTADPDRRLVSRQEVIEEHFTTTGLPVGHGYTAANRADGHAYYTFDRAGVRFVVLDTVNPNGEADGSLDSAQFAWLGTVLAAAAGRIVVVASHHTVDTMTNSLVGAGGDTSPRVLGDQVRDLLLTHPEVVAWVNGHTHVNQVFVHKVASGAGGFWEINTASHIDFPMQARLIEVADNHDGTLSIFTTMLDHAGPVTSAAYDARLGSPTALAGLSRELGANDWQERTTDRRGRVDARNLELLVGDPR